MSYAPQTASSARETVTRIDGSLTDYTYLECSQQTVEKLMRVLFEEHWRDVIVGPCIEGAVFEIRFIEGPPRLTMLDGYLTVDLGHWHFHLCIGEHKGVRSAELAQKRRVSRLAFFHTQGEYCAGGRSWGIRMWNGFGEQMTTIFLPNPYLLEDFRPARRPNWERLKLWYDLRHRFLGEPIPADIRAAGMLVENA